MSTSTASKPTTHRGWVTASLLLAMFMAAIEGTIVATAMPRIVADLGGFALYSWVFSTYLLTQVVSIPIYGKLADLYGRKPVFVFGAGVFLLGSVLCGQAHTMLTLVLFRALQGLGSGAVQPIATTVAGDLYAPEERHRVQGWFSSVWAVSSVVGPALGGFIVDYWHWSWIFYLNVPLGLAAIAGVVAFLHEAPAHRAHRIDYAGAFLLVTTVGALMLALLQGGTGWGWGDWQSLGLFGASAVSLVLLVLCERRAAEPVLPLWVFRHRLIGVAGAAIFFLGAMMLGYTAMIPTYVQGVLGGSALTAGAALAAMSIGWPLASFLSGRVVRVLGYKRMALLGAVLDVVGALGIAFGAQWGVGFITAMVFVVGMGLGFVSNAQIITIQSAVSWKERGVATANNMFMRTLGATVGVAALGAVLNAALLQGLKGTTLATDERPIDMVNAILEPHARNVADAGRQALVHALDGSMHVVFLAAFGLAAAGFLLTLFLPSQVEAVRD